MVEEEEVFQIVTQMLVNLGDQEVEEEDLILDAHLHLQDLEILHHHHHHKEILVEQVLLKIQQMAAEEVAVLVLLVETEVLLKVGMVGQDKHRLFLEHQ